MNVTKPEQPNKTYRCPRRALALLVLVAIQQAAVADDSDVVKAPYIEVGDCWSYRTTRLYNHGWVSGYEMCVTLVDRQKDLILATATIRDPDREVDISFTLDWGCGTWISGYICLQPTRFLRFPLKVGDKYSLDLDYRNITGGNNIGHHQFDVEVVGWEDVSVPAGTFHALKIVASGAYQVSRGSGGIRDTWWYVPKLSRHVKFLQRTSPIDNGWSEELTGYRLNK